MAAAAPAAAGVGAIHLLDDDLVTEDDVQSTRVWQAQHVGLARREALQQVLTSSAPWCQSTAERLALDENRQLSLLDGRWDLVIAALPSDDLLGLRAVAAWTHGSGLPSLYGHLAGLEAVVGPAVVPGKTACWNCTGCASWPTQISPRRHTRCRLRCRRAPRHGCGPTCSHGAIAWPFAGCRGAQAHQRVHTVTLARPPPDPKFGRPRGRLPHGDPAALV